MEPGESLCREIGWIVANVLDGDVWLDEAIDALKRIRLILISEGLYPGKEPEA